MKKHGVDQNQIGIPEVLSYIQKEIRGDDF